MLRSTYETFRECLRSPTPRRTAALQSLRKNNSRLCPDGLLIGSVTGMSFANFRNQYQPTLQNTDIALARQGGRARAQFFPERLEKINPRNAAPDNLRLELSEARRATVRTTEP